MDDDSDDDHLLIEVDGAEASSCGNDAEQVENPVKLNFWRPIWTLIMMVMMVMMMMIMMMDPGCKVHVLCCSEPGSFV